jgi:hypothetical protein
MYSVVHVEARYVAAFVVMFWCAVLVALQELPPRIKRPWLAAATIVVVATLLLPLALNVYLKYFQFGRGPNAEAIAAAELKTFGIRTGDHVGRISSLVTDLAIERIARVEVVAEVDFGFANDFWKAPIETQRQILDLFTANGATAVIATRPQLTDANKLEWERLASSQYWVWSPSAHFGGH